MIPDLLLPSLQIVIKKIKFTRGEKASIQLKMVSDMMAYL